MSLEENKSLVRKFLTTVVKDLDQAFELLDPDMVWWVPTDKHGGETYTKEGMHNIAANFYSVLERMIDVELLAMTAEKDRVSVLMESRGGLTKNGVSYNNDYHMFFRVHDGKIVEIREYLNPLLTAPTAPELEAAMEANQGN